MRSLAITLLALLALSALLFSGCTELGDKELFKHTDAGPLDAPPTADAAPADAESADAS